MSELADDAAAHDWSVTGAGICGKPERSMATLTWHRTPVPFAAGVSPALPKPIAKCFTLSSTASATSSGMKILAIKCPRGALVIWVVRSDLRDTVHKSRILQRKFGPTNQQTAAGQQGAKTRLPSAHHRKEMRYTAADEGPCTAPEQLSND